MRYVRKNLVIIRDKIEYKNRRVKSSVLYSPSLFKKYKRIAFTPLKNQIILEFYSNYYNPKLTIKGLSFKRLTEIFDYSKRMIQDTLYSLMRDNFIDRKLKLARYFRNNQIYRYKYSITDIGLKAVEYLFALYLPSFQIDNGIFEFNYDFDNLEYSTITTKDYYKKLRNLAWDFFSYIRTGLKFRESYDKENPYIPSKDRSILRTDLLHLDKLYNRNFDRKENRDNLKEETTFYED